MRKQGAVIPRMSWGRIILGFVGGWLKQEDCHELKANVGYITCTILKEGKEEEEREEERREGGEGKGGEEEKEEEENGI